MDFISQNTDIHQKRRNLRLRNIRISLFVNVWLSIFNYESTCQYYLNPLLRVNLPKMKFLFPPAGWIMFYNVDDTYGSAEVYGVKEEKAEFIDPHKILETKAVGYDNIHRNVLSSVLWLGEKQQFCGFLRRKFPEFDAFLVVATYYPSVVKEPGRKLYKIMYSCP